MPLDSNGFIGNIDLDPADISLTRRNWLSLGEALKQEREANFWDKRARLSVQLWAQYFDERRQDNPGERLLQLIEQDPSCLKQVDILMRGKEVLTGQRALPIVPSFEHVQTFHDLVERIEVYVAGLQKAAPASRIEMPVPSQAPAKVNLAIPVSQTLPQPTDAKPARPASRFKAFLSSLRAPRQQVDTLLSDKAPVVDVPVVTPAPQVSRTAKLAFLLRHIPFLTAGTPVGP